MVGYGREGYFTDKLSSPSRHAYRRIPFIARIAFDALVIMLFAPDVADNDDEGLSARNEQLQGISRFRRAMAHLESRDTPGTAQPPSI